MRAKLKLDTVLIHEHGEDLTFSAVGASDYPPGGLDEDNTYARWTPTATLTMAVKNPELLGKFRPGQKFLVDFTALENK